MQLDAAFSKRRKVLQRHLLLRQSAEHLARTFRLLKGVAHEVLLLLADQQAETMEGTWGGLPLPAPAALGGRGVRTMPRETDHFQTACIGVKVVPILLLGVDHVPVGVSVKFLR